MEPTIKYVEIEQAYSMRYEGNPKLHDIPALIASLRKYGYQELAKYDETLQAVKAGNGRLAALRAMYLNKPDEPPRGVRVENGKWYIPIVFGVNAATRDEAKAYAIDSNDLTLSGGIFSDIDFINLYDEAALRKMLSDMTDMPLTLTTETLDFIFDDEPAEVIGLEPHPGRDASAMSQHSAMTSGKDTPPKSKILVWGQIRTHVPYDLYQEALEHAKGFINVEDAMTDIIRRGLDIADGDK